MTTPLYFGIAFILVGALWIHPGLFLIAFGSLVIWLTL